MTRPAQILLSIGLILGLSCSVFGDSAEAASSSTLCTKPTTKTAACFARLRDARATTAPQGYGPAQLRSAYKLTGNGSAKLAIVDAYGDPGIKADLDTYSRAFGLPVLPTCTSAAATSCFEKIDQHGGTKYPRTNAGWAVETALDVEAAHGLCPGCRLELVEATTASTTNLMAAVDQAVASGASIISMSWGASETSSQLTADQHFQHPNVLFVASAGDSGYGTSWPAASNHVLAVGGTHLELTNTGGRSTETAWSGTGSGCSRYEAKPAWQHDPACARRAVADVSADADPSTGAAVYSSTSSSGSGWFVVGGTSLAAPLVAATAGLASVSSQAAVSAQLYGSLGTSRLYDITAGSNGTCTTYLCRAGAGYDGPTGVGALVGLGAL